MNTRLHKIDEIRGFTLISMVLYHFMWDLVYIAGIKAEWYTGPLGYVWQKSICITFIIISGFCFCMGKKRIQRNTTVFLAGIIVTAATIIFMPENRVVFGILTFIGTAGFITVIVDNIHRKIEELLDKRTINLTMIIGMLILFIVFYQVNYGKLFLFHKTQMLPKYLYSGYFSTFLGFPDPTFFSTDYFSIFPWIFIYLFGYYLYRLLMTESVLENRQGLLYRKGLKPISFIGRNTLLIYMVHQPVLYLITLFVQRNC